MDKIVHFVDYFLIDNIDKLYDVKFINDNLLCTCDIGSNINYYSITKDDTGNTLTYTKTDSIKLKGSSIFSIDYKADMTLAGMEDGSISIFKHNKPIYSSIPKENENQDSISKCRFITENLFAIGEGSGRVVLYDIRAKPKSKPIATFKEQGEEITDVAYSDSREEYLLSSSIDGTLCVYDIRKMKLYALSDCIEEEINCLQIVKDGAKVACGTGEGNIALFNWDWFGDYKDRLTGHPQGILCMLKYNDNVLITGCEDGGIRINTVYPKSTPGIISGNKEKKIDNKEFGDVISMGINDEEGGLLASVCNINYVKVFDISEIDFRGIELKNGDDEKEEDEDLKGGDDDGSEDVFGNANDDKGGNDHEEDEEINDDNANELEEVSDDGEEQDDNDNNDNTLPKTKQLDDSNLGINENESNKSIESNIKEEDDEEDNGLDSNSDSDSSSKQKKKSKKVLSLGKKRYSEAIISREKRKEFFNDL